MFFFYFIIISFDLFSFFFFYKHTLRKVFVVKEQCNLLSLYQCLRISKNTFLHFCTHWSILLHILWLLLLLLSLLLLLLALKIWNKNNLVVLMTVRYLLKQEIKFWWVQKTLGMWTLPNFMVSYETQYCCDLIWSETGKSFS